MRKDVMTRLLHHTVSFSCADALSAAWRELLSNMFYAYRPELHYMRGPGPKWRARQANRGRAIEEERAQ
jgi:hypothetical protein